MPEPVTLDLHCRPRVAAVAALGLLHWQWLGQCDMRVLGQVNGHQPIEGCVRACNDAPKFKRLIYNRRGGLGSALVSQTAEEATRPPHPGKTSQRLRVRPLQPCAGPSQYRPEGRS
jgi:hypothetical protein